MISQSQILFNAVEVLNQHLVKALLIGGQACVIYGAKTSTVDIDFSILVTETNLSNLEKALNELSADPSPLSVPIDKDLLSRGHSLHYYCNKKDYNGMRIDILGYLPQLDPFDALWQRKFQFKNLNILSLKDLVSSKKTGRLKDATDIAALVRAHYAKNYLEPSDTNKRFWLLEAREVETLELLVEKYKTDAKKLIKERPLLEHALNKDYSQLATSLAQELAQETSIHQAFRKPLVAEAKELSRERRNTLNR